MGSCDNKHPFECFEGDCLRKAWVDDDMGEFLCFVCYLKEENDRAALHLRARPLLKIFLPWRAWG